MRKIVAPALLFTLGLLSLPLAIVSKIYLKDSADVGTQGPPAAQFDIPVAELLPVSIIMVVLGAAWLAYAVPKYVKVDDSALVDAVDEVEEDSALARAAAVETMAVEVVPIPIDDLAVDDLTAQRRRAPARRAV